MTAVPNTDITPLRPGLVLDRRYELLDPIGAGGMAQVWRARQVRLGRTVAVKVLLPTLSEDNQFRRRFDREGVTVGKLRRHPHIVGVIDSGVDQGHMYIVMEYIAGNTLEDRLRQGNSPMSGAEVLDLLEPIADAIDVAHEHDLVHRDIKPGNILLEEHTHHPFLADFGIAKDWNAGSLTNTRNAFATLRYSAPEVLMGDVAEIPADIYSLALVAYEALTGGHGPYLGMDGRGLIGAHLTKPPLALEPTSDPSSHEVHQVLCRGLAKAPAERSASATELVAELRGAVSAEALGRRPTYTPAFPAVTAVDDEHEPTAPAPQTADLARPRAPATDISGQVSERIAEVAFMDEVSGDTADIPAVDELDAVAEQTPSRRPRRRVSLPPWWPAALAAPLLALPIAAFATRPETPRPAGLSVGDARFEALPGTRPAGDPQGIAAAAFPLDLQGDTIATGAADQGVALTAVERGRVPLAPDDAGEGRLIKFDGGQARRYETPRRTIVIAQTPTTALWLGCRRPAGEQPSSACERAISTLSLEGEQLQGDPLPELAEQLSKAQARPKASRSRLPLPVHDLPRRADRADSIAAAYAEAATSTRKLAERRPRDADLQQLAEGLDDTRAAYRKLAAAARDKSTAQDRDGRRALQRADGAVYAALDRFETRGYTIGTPAQ